MKVKIRVSFLVEKEASNVEEVLDILSNSMIIDYEIADMYVPHSLAFDDWTEFSPEEPDPDQAQELRAEMLSDTDLEDS